MLAAGVVLGFSGSSKTYPRLIKNLPVAWKDIDRTTLRRAITEFKYKRLVDFKTEPNGETTVVVTKRGKRHVLRYDPERLSIKIPSRWDKKWRVVVFDIPEKKRLARDTLRREIKKLGFFELQKSVWAFPYGCENVIDFLVELFEIRTHVRTMTVMHISHDADMRLHFNLT